MPFTAEEDAVWATLTSPRKLQDYLDETPYSEDPFYRSPRSVMRDRRAHCLDGALFAACGLRRLGFRPLVVDLTSHRDDDHVIAVFEVDGCWGAVAKSNTVGLRFREPVYRSVRELAMSYFDFYYNLEREKSLRTHSDPFDLSAFDGVDWETDDSRLEDVVVAPMYHLPHHDLLTPAQIARLTPVDERLFDACLQGANWAGLWKND